jgi:hypothetical protein
MTTISKIGVLIALASAPAACSAQPSEDIFSNEDAALTFTASLGADWVKPSEKIDRALSNGNRQTIFRYHFDNLKGMMVVEADKLGKLRRYEVRFPLRENECVGAPDRSSLAKKLLTNTEPTSLENIRNVNLLARLPDLVWPYSHVVIGPSTQFGETAFEFTRLNGYCGMRVFRMSEDG